VVAQTFGSWEAVVVDDGSVEDLAWVDDLDPRIRLVRQPPRGISAARNLGIARTSAPLVAFLDADDEWLPGKLDRQVEALTAHPDVAMVDTAFRRMDGLGKDIGPGYSGNHRNYYELLEGCGICISTTLVRRTTLEEIGGFAPMTMVEDWELFLRVARVASIDLRVGEVLARYRVHAGGISRNYLAIFTAATKMLWQHRRRACEERDMAAVRSADAGIAALRSRGARLALDAARREWSERSYGATAKHLTVASALGPRYMAGKARQQGAQLVTRW
jgi:glycosyltransferase involved in cell wall biosynthesis